MSYHCSKKKRGGGGHTRKNARGRGKKRNTRKVVGGSGALSPMALAASIAGPGVLLAAAGMYGLYSKQQKEKLEKERNLQLAQDLSLSSHVDNAQDPVVDEEKSWEERSKERWEEFNKEREILHEKRRAERQRRQDAEDAIDKARKEKEDADKLKRKLSEQQEQEERRRIHDAEQLRIVQQQEKEEKQRIERRTRENEYEERKMNEDITKNSQNLEDYIAIPYMEVKEQYLYYLNKAKDKIKDPPVMVGPYFCVANYPRFASKLYRLYADPDFLHVFNFRYHSKYEFPIYVLRQEHEYQGIRQGIRQGLGQEIPSEEEHENVQDNPILQVGSLRSEKGKQGNNLTGAVTSDLTGSAVDLTGSALAHWCGYRLWLLAATAGA